MLAFVYKKKLDYQKFDLLVKKWVKYIAVTLIK